MIVSPVHSGVKVLLKSVIKAKYTFKNKGASKVSSSDAVEEPFLVPQKTIQSKVV